MNRIFTTRILPKFTGISQTEPTALIIIGQPGAGKSTVEKELCGILGHKDFITVDGDDLYPYHPDFYGIAQRDDVQAYALALPSVMYWSDKLLQHVVHQKYNLVASLMPSADGSQPCIYMLRANGYRIEVAFLAINQTISRHSVIERYLDGRRKHGFGRWSSMDEFAGLMAAQADHIERTHYAEAVHVVRRGGRLLHTKHWRADKGQWSTSVPASERITQELQRPWTEEEKNAFRRTHDRITEAFGLIRSSPSVNMEKIIKWNWDCAQPLLGTGQSSPGDRGRPVHQSHRPSHTPQRSQSRAHSQERPGGIPVAHVAAPPLPRAATPRGGTTVAHVAAPPLPRAATPRGGTTVAHVAAPPLPRAATPRGGTTVAHVAAPPLPRAATPRGGTTAVPYAARADHRTSDHHRSTSDHRSAVVAAAARGTGHRGPVVAPPVRSYTFPVPAPAPAGSGRRM